MGLHKHLRDNSRYCRELPPIGSRHYELNHESGRTYLAVPREDLERLGLIPDWNPRAFLSEESKRSWAGEVVYLNEKDTDAFCDVYCQSVGREPDMRKKSNGARSLISRLPFIYDEVEKPSDPVLPEIVPFSCGDEASGSTEVTRYNPIVQSVTDFIMYVMVHDLVDNHPVQGPRMLNTSLRLLRTWIRSKTPALSGKFYDDKTRMMWVLQLRTSFPVCPTCHTEFGRMKNIHLSKTYLAYQPHCSSRCARLDPTVLSVYRDSCIDRFGVDHPSKSGLIREKTRRTLVERYGSDCLANVKIFREKAIATSRMRYGTDYPAQNPMIRSKVDETMKKKYGTSYSTIVPEFREKAVKTLISRYGVDSPLKNPEIRNRARETTMERYGVSYPVQSRTIMDRIIKKRISNRRLENRPQLDGLVFDSSWELKFYSFCKDNNLDVEYHPCCFEYEYNGKQHRYYPDFRVGDKLYEIKGDCFINKDGTWRSPFRREGISDKEYEEECNQIEEKRQCMVRHGVIIVSRDEMRRLGEVVCG